MIDPYADPDYSGDEWLFPPGAPRIHGFGVHADFTERICHNCYEDEGCCECPTPDLVSPLEHKTRIWNERVAYAQENGLNPATLNPR